MDENKMFSKLLIIIMMVIELVDCNLKPISYSIVHNDHATPATSFVTFNSDHQQSSSPFVTPLVSHQSDQHHHHPHHSHPIQYIFPPTEAQPIELVFETALIGAVSSMSHRPHQPIQTYEGPNVVAPAHLPPASIISSDPTVSSPLAATAVHQPSLTTAIGSALTHQTIPSTSAVLNIPPIPPVVASTASIGPSSGLIPIAQPSLTTGLIGSQPTSTFVKVPIQPKVQSLTSVPLTMKPLSTFAGAGIRPNPVTILTGGVTQLQYSNLNPFQSYQTLHHFHPHHHGVDFGSSYHGASLTNQPIAFAH
ncbi:hypothetical protein SSS_06362 [Sarcoptes scabiei]|uniref:Uncharacterized protein n=1 Tax=Sarcoptes scabiei TaxID=52283 RepID=A0A834R5T3_SARSC|nr:hypothetical protein SSS_06362 [Sarcoptes scabiei]